MWSGFRLVIVGRAAAAGAFGIGIGDFEACALEAFGVVDFDAEEPV